MDFETYCNYYGRFQPERITNAHYERAAFDLRIDYRCDPEPPLTGDDAIWADQLLRQSGVR